MLWGSFYSCCPLSALLDLMLLFWCLCLAAFHDSLFFPLFSNSIKIATVEAAKAKGTDGCEPCLSSFCVVHPLNIEPPVNASHLSAPVVSPPPHCVVLFLFNSSPLLYDLMMGALALPVSVCAHWVGSNCVKHLKHGHMTGRTRRGEVFSLTSNK